MLTAKCGGKTAIEFPELPGTNRDRIPSTLSNCQKILEKFKAIDH
jgi:hypothetical protein